MNEGCGELTPKVACLRESSQSLWQQHKPLHCGVIKSSLVLKLQGTAPLSSYSDFHLNTMLLPLSSSDPTQAAARHCPLFWRLVAHSAVYEASNAHGFISALRRHEFNRLVAWVFECRSATESPTQRWSFHLYIHLRRRRADKSDLSRSRQIRLHVDD